MLDATIIALGALFGYEDFRPAKIGAAAEEEEEGGE